MTYMQLAQTARAHEQAGELDDAGDCWFEAHQAAKNKHNRDWAEARWMFCRKHAAKYRKAA